MTTTAGKNYLNADHSIRSWLTTVDHKRIGILYLISVTAFFFLGGLFALLMRLELLTPHGDLFQSDLYNRIFTMHGITMVFFFLIPSIPGVMGNFVLPIMIGAKDMAFPRMNLISWYVYMAGALIALTSVILGGVDTGWTFYTPYSSTYSNSAVTAAALGVFVSGISSILTGINFIVTVHKMRAPGMTWFRLPLFVWAHYATAIIMVLGTPVVAMTILLVFLERAFHFGFFDPRLGGDPILFQHLFWFYSHPAVYIMILPGMGVISELVACFAKKRPFGYEFIAGSSLAIALLGFFIWGHHMFVSSQSIYSSVVFSALTFLIGLPSAVKVFNWVATLYKGSVTFEAPMLYVFGFFGLFMIGGLTGLFCATLAIDIHIHDTYFVVAHFHYIMVGASVMAYLGGIHFWWPKMTGKMYNERFAQIFAVLIFIGFNLTFFPQFIAGYLGMPRRYHIYADEFQIFNILSSSGAMILGTSFLMPILNLLWSLKNGKPATMNPWGAKGLEWNIPSPPTTHNFDQTPVVTEEAYEYSPMKGGH